jgi:hypothetical protein
MKTITRRKRDLEFGQLGSGHGWDGYEYRGMSYGLNPGKKIHWWAYPCCILLDGWWLWLLIAFTILEK